MGLSFRQPWGTFYMRISAPLPITKSNNVSEDIDASAVYTTVCWADSGSVVVDVTSCVTLATFPCPSLSRHVTHVQFHVCVGEQLHISSLVELHRYIQIHQMANRNQSVTFPRLSMATFWMSPRLDSTSANRAMP